MLRGDSPAKGHFYFLESCKKTQQEAAECFVYIMASTPTFLHIHRYIGRYVVYDNSVELYRWWFVNIAPST